MSKGGKSTRFVGYALPKRDVKQTVSLIEMTTGRLGLHKRFFKNEDTFWTAISLVTGKRREEGETFSHAIMRIHGHVVGRSAEKRNEMIAAVDRKKFYEAIGVNVSEAALMLEVRQAAAEAPKRPKVKRVRNTPARLKAPVTLHAGQKTSPSVATKEEFYKSWEWRTLRMEVLKEQGRSCKCCGSEPGMTDIAGNPVRIVVDHIKPISKFWHLRLDKSNLQILCDECNQGKGNWDQTDFRAPAAPDEWLVDSPDVDPTILEQLSVHGETIQ